MIRVAQAGSDENYKYKNGQAGDQRKTKPDANGCFLGELNVEPWYNKPWDVLIRPKSEIVANAIAGNIHTICLNKNVGYDQNNDESLWNAFEKLGWTPLSIAKLPLCECDCCRLVDVGIRLAGITNIPNLKHKYTANIKAALQASGHFDILTGAEYTQSTAKLKRGDLLLQEGHHIVVVLDSATEEKAAPYKIYKCVACCLRTEGSTKGKILAYLHPGDFVSLTGWSPSGWGHVTFNGKTGYVAPQFLLPVTTVQVNVWRANIRQGAGTNTQAMTVVANGTKLAVKGNTIKNGGTTWFPVNYNGYNGFISEKCVKVI